MTSRMDWSPKQLQPRAPFTPDPNPSWIEQPTVPSDKCCNYSNSDELIDIENEWKDFLLGLKKFPPKPSFTWVVNGMEVTFTPDPGVVPPATVATESWYYGDGTSGGATDLVHVYAMPGLYTVTYSVTDSLGLSGSATNQVQVGFLAPTARFTPIRKPALTYGFDASASTAIPPATLTSYDWDFGDGTTGTGVIPPDHVFPDIGPYTVALTVTDSNGLTDTTSHVVYPEAVPINQPPVAEFDYVVDDLVVTFDGSDSYDVDGTVVSYAWDFGDTP